MPSKGAPARLYIAEGAGLQGKIGVSYDVRDLIEYNQVSSYKVSRVPSLSDWCLVPQVVQMCPPGSCRPGPSSVQRAILGRHVDTRVGILHNYHLNYQTLRNI